MDTNLPKKSSSAIIDVENEPLYLKGATKFPVPKESLEAGKSKSSQRKLNASTAVALYKGNERLIINSNPSNSKLVRSFNCSACMKYKDLICSIKC